MSDFEFVSIILSIVIGLGITRVLGGLAGALRHRGTFRSHRATVVWSVTVLLMQVLYWLGTVNSYRQKEPVITMASFATLLLGSIALYFAASLILPDEIGPDSDLSRHFAAVRRPFYVVLASVPVLELTDTLTHGLPTLAALGWPYHVALATVFVGAAVGYISEERRTHEILSLLAGIGVVGWLLVRFYVI